MSPNPYPFFLVTKIDKPEQIKEKTRMLIKLYLKDPNPFIADAVAKHITAMLAHPKYLDDIEQRCQYRKLEKHWRCLAWIGSDRKFISSHFKNQRIVGRCLER